MIQVTLLYAGLLGLLAVLLANLVLYVRLRPAQQPAWRAEATMRVQANFVENAPLALLLLFVLESAGTEPAALHVFGAALLVFRILHAWGLARYAGPNYPRLIGAQGTFLLISIMSVASIHSWLA